MVLGKQLSGWLGAKDETVGLSLHRWSQFELGEVYHHVEGQD